MEEFSGEWGKLRDTLNLIMVFVSVRRQERQHQALRVEIRDIEIEVREARYAAGLAHQCMTAQIQDVRLLRASSPAPDLDCNSPLHARIMTPGSDEDQCPPRHACEFSDVAPKYGALVPSKPIPLLGQAKVSTQAIQPILDIVGLSCRRCKRRGCKSTAPDIIWYTSSWGQLIASAVLLLLPFTVSVRASRLIPRNAPIWQAIWKSDVEEARRLFQAREASVCDVDSDGWTVLESACNYWITNRTSKNWKMIKFLVDAGADPDFAAGSRFPVKRMIYQASLGTMLEHPNGSFLNVVRTSPIAIEICNSILGLDIVDDILDEFRSRDTWPSAAPDAHFDNITIPSTDSDPLGAKLNQYRQYLREDPLKYAIEWMPSEFSLRLVSLYGTSLGNRFPPHILVTAVQDADGKLVRALLSACVDANECDVDGWTALHRVSYALYLPYLKILAELSDRIDWLARTPEGKNILQLVKESPYWSWKTPPEREEILVILRAHISEEEDEPSGMPGAFPA